MMTNSKRQQWSTAISNKNKQEKTVAMLFSQESHSQPYVAPAVGATINMVIFYGHDYDYDYDSDYDSFSDG